MLKISVINGRRQRQLVVEGTLVELWVAELLSEYTKAKEHLDGRELVIDLTNLNAISKAGEDALLELIDDHARFHCGVFAKEVLKQLTSKRRSK
jgi:anti-anti-sigma regulatory factor